MELKQSKPPPKQLPPPSPAGSGPFGFNPAAIKLKSTGLRIASKGKDHDAPSSPIVSNKPSPQTAPRPNRAGSVGKNRANSITQEQTPAPPPPPGPPAPPGGPPGAPPPPPPPPPMGFNGLSITDVLYNYMIYIYS